MCVQMCDIKCVAVPPQPCRRFNGIDSPRNSTEGMDSILPKYICCYDDVVENVS